MDSRVGTTRAPPRKVSQNGPIYSSKHPMPQLLDDGCGREFSDRELAAIEQTTLEVGRHILERSSQQRPTIFARRCWDDRIMDWAMRDESVKVQMFRFVDVLPMLSTNRSITEHLQEYFCE